jgi:membrane protease YdiL (CAAX protease family)
MGGFGMSKIAIILIIISGIIFGLAHYPGWDDQVWKVASAAIGGIFFGYLFVRFGLYAAIFMHFITDYLSSFNWMGVGGLSIIVSFLLLGTGFIAIFYIIRRLWDHRTTIGGLPLFRVGKTEER